MISWATSLGASMKDHRLHKAYDQFVAAVPTTDLFAQGRQASIWLRGKYSEMFVRYSPSANEFVLANLNVYPKYRGQHVLKNFVNHIKQQTIKIENAMPDVVFIYERLGFEKLSSPYEEGFGVYQMIKRK